MTLVNTETGALVAPCSRDEALELTSCIRDAAENVWAMLVEAHDRRAWAALDYGTFADYVKAEFDMSRRHAYRLLDQAEVIRELEAAVVDVTHGSHAPVAVTERQARDIKPRLSEVKKDIVKQLDAEAVVEPERVQEIVADVIAEHREKKAKADEDRAALADLSRKAEAAGMDMDQASLEERGNWSTHCREVAKTAEPVGFVQRHRQHFTKRHIEQAERAYAWLDSFLLEIKEGE